MLIYVTQIKYPPNYYVAVIFVGCFLSLPFWRFATEFKLMQHRLYDEEIDSGAVLLCFGL